MKPIAKQGPNKDRIVGTLKRHERDLRVRGARALYLFGSTARGRATKSSDVDLFVDYYPGRRFSIVDLLKLRDYVQGLLRRNVDLLTRQGLHRLIRRRVEADAIKIY